MSKQQITDRELHEIYDEMIDDISGEIKIGNLSYSASDTLKAVDPIAYRVGFDDWLDAEISDGRYHMDDQGNVYLGDDDE